MTIAKTLCSLNGLIILTVALTSLLFQGLVGSMDSMNSIQRRRNDLLLLADEMRSGSEKLTSLARRFAVTGDAKFETAYQAVADQRSGQRARPADARIAPGESRVLLDLLRERNVTREELKLMEEAARMSERLMNVEMEAFRAVKGYKDRGDARAGSGVAGTDTAARMLFDAAYQNEVNAIMARLDRFAAMLEERTGRELAGVRRSVARNRLLVMGCLAAVLAASLASMLWGFRRVSRPLAETTRFAARVAAGAPGAPIAVRSRDEIGSLRTTLNTMVENLKARLKDVEEASATALSREREACAAHRAAEKAGEAARAGQDGMARAADKLESLLRVVDPSLHALAARVDQAEHGARGQAADLAETAAALDEMSVAAVETARNAEDAARMSALMRDRAVEGAGVVKRSVDGIRAVREDSQRLKSDMLALEERARDISRIMEVISDIADQTNLLALNAAIEAARAGDAGRGFAVVADEVRKLAEKTMASTTDVRDAILAIQDSAAQNRRHVDETARSIEDATGLVEQSGAALDEIADMVDEVANRVESIARAGEQQGAAGEAINHSVSQINAIAEETARTMTEAAHAVEELAAQSQVLITLIADMHACKTHGASGLCPV